MTHVPKLIDTDKLVLPTSLHEIVEILAENAHDVWASERRRSGWTYGLARDDSAKRHPCLVPYAELPESEKVFDRDAAMETLKAILAMGYRIVPPDRSPSGLMCNSQTDCVADSA